MNNNSTHTHAKKLKSVRKILWLCFAGISIPVVLSFVGLLLAFGLQNSIFIVPGPDGNPVSILPFLFISPFMLFGVIGVMLLVVYHILKYRIDKDEELFL